MIFQRSKTVAVSLNVLAGVTAAVLLLSGCSSDVARPDDTRGKLAAVVNDYLHATTPPYDLDPALTSGETPDLYAAPDEYRTVWMGYLTTTTGTDFVNDPQWQKVLAYLQDHLRSILTDDEIPDRGPFVSGADRIDRIAGLIPTEEFSQQTKELLSTLIARARPKLDRQKGIASIADESLLIRANIKAGNAENDTGTLKSRVLSKDLQAKAEKGEIEAIRALTLAGYVLPEDEETGDLFREGLPVWASKLTVKPLSVETAPVLYEIRGLAETMGLSLNLDLPGYAPDIAAFGKRWIGIANTAAPDPQLTFYWRSFGLLKDAIDWKNGSLPSGGWSQSVKPSLLGTATNQTLQEQFNGTSPSGDQLSAQRVLIKQNLKTLANDLSSIQSTSFLAAASHYRPTPSEQQKLTAAAVKTIQQALNAKDYFVASSMAAVIENFGMEPRTLRPLLHANFKETPQDTITNQYALSRAIALFGKEDTEIRPDFSRFNVAPGSVSPEHPQRITDIALVARLNKWSDDDKYAALKSFINKDTKQLCAFSDCRKASISAPDLLAVSTLSKPTLGPISAPRIL